MICVPSKYILQAARGLPIGYFEDCQAACIIDEKHDLWCFSEADYSKIRRKYRGYAVSEADPYREGEIISGCCDRADQY